MATYSGTYIPTGASSNSRINRVVDTYLTPRLMGFRQIEMFEEPATLMRDQATWRVNFGNWLSGYDWKVRKNGQPLLAASVTIVSYTYGTFTCGTPNKGSDNRPQDEVTVTYQFDYFPIAILEGFIYQSIQHINTAAFGPPTTFTVDTAPDYWDSVIADFVFAVCMEKLLLDYDLWKYRLIFAIGPNEVESGGGDIVAQLETLKENAETRLNQSIENEKFKSGNYISVPTVYYFDSIRGIGSSGRHGVPFVGGRLRGWRPNKYL